MIVAVKTASVKSSGIQEAVSFGIKEGGLAHIFNVLRSQLYSDKILAVLREYSANAIDANVEAGKASTPIVVTLPNRLSLNFKVRDNGFGLSDEDIREVYAFYGESTKRNSNALVGQLGLGSKSAFAYGDNFVINSFVKGTKSTYNAFIDDSQVGQIAKLSSEKTEESDGVEIVIAVRSEDVHAFEEKAKEFFKHFKVKPEILGASIKFSDEAPSLAGIGWSVDRDSRHGAVAVMGNIPYPINYESLQISDTALSNLCINSGLVLEFRIGDLDVAASRESLQFTKRTIAAVIAKLRIVDDEISSKIQTKFDSCKNIFDVKCLYADVFEWNGLFGRFATSVKNPVWDGTKISDSQLETNNTPLVSSCRKYAVSYRGKNIKGSDADRINCSANTVIVFNDTQLKNGIINRVHNLVSVQKKVVYVLTVAPASLTKYLADTGLVMSNFTNISSLVPTVLTSASGSASSGVKLGNAKHSSKEFFYAVNTSVAKISYYQATCSSYWSECNVDFANDSGVYVAIERFEYSLIANNLKGKHPHDLKGILLRLEKVGIKVPKLFGFKSASVLKAKESGKFIPLSEYVATALKAKLDKEKLGESLSNRISHQFNRVPFWRLFSFSDKCANEKGVFAQAVRKIGACSEGASWDRDNPLSLRTKNLDGIHEIATLFSVNIDDYKSTHDIPALNALLLAKYPMIGLMDNMYCDWKKSEAEKSVITYIDMIDKFTI